MLLLDRLFDDIPEDVVHQINARSNNQDILIDSEEDDDDPVPEIIKTIWFESMIIHT